MGADNHPTVKVGDDGEQSANIPSVNGHALADLAGVEAAFGYLDKDYNGGHITRTMNGDRVIIRSRYRGFQHMDALLDSHACEGGVRVANVTAERHAGEVRTRVEVEAVEDDEDEPSPHDRYMADLKAAVSDE